MARQGGLGDGWCVLLFAYSIDRTKTKTKAQWPIHASTAPLLSVNCLTLYCPPPVGHRNPNCPLSLSLFALYSHRIGTNLSLSSAVSCLSYRTHTHTPSSPFNYQSMLILFFYSYTEQASNKRMNEEKKRVCASALFC